MYQEEPLGIPSWECVKCHREFIDPDDLPEAWTKHGIEHIQQKEYWLGPTEPVCATCAGEIGIPSIDED